MYYTKRESRFILQSHALEIRLFFPFAEERNGGAPRDDYLC